MHKDLKKAIFNYMIDNLNSFSLLNDTTKHFKQYIFTSEGNYLIGGKEVNEYIRNVEKLIK